MGLLIEERLDLRVDQQWINTAAVTLQTIEFWCHMSSACFPFVAENAVYFAAFASTRWSMGGKSLAA